MTLTLSIISLVSLATTGALLIYVARLIRDERDRAEARVAALSEAIWRQDTRLDASQTSDYALAADSDLPLSHTQRDAEPILTAARLEEAPRSLEGGPSAGETRTLFADSLAQDAGTGMRRWVAPIVGVLIVVGMVAAGTLARMSSRDSSDVATVTDERLHDTPLQLLSLRHERDGESLTISGLVRNPAGGAAHERTDVVVFTFDRAGIFITSVRSAVADPSLAGGSESPFSVTIPNGGNVSRYRVSFRTGNRMLPHVDRRADAQPGHEVTSTPDTRGRR